MHFLCRVLCDDEAVVPSFVFFVVLCGWMIFCALVSRYLWTRLPWIIPWGMNKVFWIDTELKAHSLWAHFCAPPLVEWIHCWLTSDWLTRHQQTFICVSVSPAFIWKTSQPPTSRFSPSHCQAVAPQLPRGSWWRCWGSRENIVWTTVKHSSLQLPDQRQRITNSLL